MVKAQNDDFGNYKDDSLTKPRDLAWDNWAKFAKVGDKVQGYIRDAFFRAQEGDFAAQRGITLEQIDGTFVNVGIKRYPFVLDKTDNLRIGDPLTVEFVEQKTPAQKGKSGVKVFAFYGKNLEANAGNKTVLELDPYINTGDDKAKKDFDALSTPDNDIPFEGNESGRTE